MKYKALWKDTFREIPKSIMRFLAILIIIFLGVGFFVGISATSPDMMITLDNYFDEQNLMDIRVQSTYGLTEEDIDDLHTLDGAAVQSHYAYDFFVEDYAEAIRLYSYDAKNGQDLNQYHVAEGRLPEASGEIALDTRATFLEGVALGDTLALQTGSSNGSPEDHLKTQTFEVVGFVDSPLHITHQSRGNTTVGSGSLDGFGVVLETDYDTEFYTEANLLIANAQEHMVFSKDYEETIAPYEAELEEQLATFETRRAETIQEEAQGEIDDAWAELEDGEEELASAEADLEEARAELDDAWAEFEDGYAEFQEQWDAALAEVDRNEQQLDQTIADLRSQRQDLINQRRQLQNQRAELDSNEEQLEAGRAELEDGLAQLEDGIAQIEANRSQIEAGLAEIESQRNELTSQRASLVTARDNLSQLDAAIQELTAQITALEDDAENDEQLTALIAERESLLAQRAGIGQALGDPEISVEAINQQIAQMDSGLAELARAEEEARAPLEELDGLISQRTALEGQLAELDAQADQLEAGRAQITEGIAAINDGLPRIDAGLAEAQNGYAALEEARETIADEFAEAEAELTEAEEELNAAEEEYRDGLLTFQEERRTALAEMEDARLELEEAEANLADLPEPDYFQTLQTEVASYTEYKDNTDRLAVIANVFPVFFFLIAIFISFTTMTRMVDEEREYIGIMKSLGYANQQILIKFLTYSILGTTIGSLLGLLVGYTFIPNLIFDAYGSMYNLPSIHTQQYTLYTVIALGAAFFSTVGASLLAVRKSLKSNAATLLQPKAPSKGTHIWLENIPFIWKRLSFNYKVTFRNVFRYKSRMFMTIFGIAGSTGLVLTGFGISDSISSIPDVQYSELNHFQAYVAMDTNASENSLNNYLTTIDSHPELDETIFVYQDNVTLEEENVNTQEAAVFVPEDTANLGEFVTLRHPETGEELVLDDSGALITMKLADLFDVQTGDEMALLAADDEVWTVEIAGVVENYVGHTIYMTEDYFNDISGADDVDMNLSLLKYDADAVDQDTLGNELMNQNAVLGMTYSSEIYDSFSGTLNSLELITQILVIAAAALAFIILYNLTNINVSERERELSTIKVLGFHDREVTMYIYRENIILTLIGIFFGCIFGTILVRFIMATMEVDNLVFGREIHLTSYLFAIVLTLLFTLVVMVVIHYQLKRINMVEALKAND